MAPRTPSQQSDARPLPATCLPMTSSELTSSLELAARSDTLGSCSPASWRSLERVSPAPAAAHLAPQAGFPGFPTAAAGNRESLPPPPSPPPLSPPIATPPGDGLLSVAEATPQPSDEAAAPAATAAQPGHADVDVSIRGGSLGGPADQAPEAGLLPPEPTGRTLQQGQPARPSPLGREHQAAAAADNTTAAAASHQGLERQLQQLGLGQAQQPMASQPFGGQMAAGQQQQQLPLPLPAQLQQPPLQLQQGLAEPPGASRAVLCMFPGHPDNLQTRTDFQAAAFSPWFRRLPAHWRLAQPTWTL